MPTTSAGKWLFGLIVSLLILLFSGFLISQAVPSKNNPGQQVCPEAWYEDRMPSITPDGKPAATQNQYFIVSGKRVEYSALDVNWVKQNCSINKPEVVQ